MSNILNLFLNDNFTKKSINDYAAIYKSNKNNLYTFTPSLTQGEKFKKYQKKIKNLKKSNIESFQGINFDNLNKNGLTKQSQQVLQSNNYLLNDESTINNLRQEYQNTLKQYEELVLKISGSTTAYINRVNPNNPYLNKTVRFTSGHVAYVTNQGVVKYIPSIDIWNSVNAPKETINLSIPWDDNWNNVSGIKIQTNPPLITGTFVKYGQSLGNEGTNVFVDSLIKTLRNSYLGCFRNIPSVTNIRYSPKLSVDSPNSYSVIASSIYKNNVNAFGPWCAFDDNLNTWWHSQDESPHLYNQENGQYIGTVSISLNGKPIMGEYLQFNHPNFELIPLTKYDLLGRQDCCGKPNGRDPNTWYILGYNPENDSWNQVDYQENISFNLEMKTFTVGNPKPYGAYIMITTVVGDSHAPAITRYCLQITTWNLYTSSNYNSNLNPAMTNVGKMTFDECEKYSLTSGNQYFGLQSVDNYGIGNCMVSDSSAAAKVYGEANIFTPIVLWESKTSGNSGIMASLTNMGLLTVFNSNSQAIFSSDLNSRNKRNYIGCYNDCYTGRALPTILGNEETYDTCSVAAKNGNWKYFGLQSTQPNGKSECWVGNDIGSGMSMGRAGNCTTLNEIQVGGSCSNAIYTTDSELGSNYYLILEDDGNMSICRGLNPNDNQGKIWSTMTTNKQQNPNINFTASKGKTGKNWISSGITLASNEFIGSNDGSIYLLMQSDGNLVLYTSKQSSSCSTKEGKNIGQQDVNALYQLDSIGIKTNIGKLGYIDQDSMIHEYSNNNKQGTSNYSLVANGIDSLDNDIPGAVYGNATFESCQTTCNNSKDCAGFVMNGENNICWPKTSAFYPNGNISVNADRKIYYRSQKPINTPIGVSNNINSIDTEIYQNYINGGNLSSQYGLANANTLEKEELNNLQLKMNLLASQISDLTGKLGDSSQETESQSYTNNLGIKDYLKTFDSTNKKIKRFNTNVENILNDSDIVVLQKNYEYLFWSILATGAVLVTMNIVKKS